MSFLDPEVLKDSVTWPRSAGPCPSPPPSPQGCQGTHGPQCSLLSARVLPFAPCPCSALPATLPADGRPAPSLPLLSSCLSPPLSPLLLKFRWTNKPSRKAAEIRCIYPRVHGLYESTADWTGQNPHPTCFMLSFPGAALSDDWIVQWVSLEELAAVTPPGKKKVPSSTPHQISFADPKGEKSCNPLPQRQHEKLWNFRILTLPLVIRFDLFEAIKR